MTTAARPLDGVRVLELARSQTGLRGGMILSDLLAEVIKIEPPVEEICEMDDPVVGEMYLPGVAVKMSKTPGRIGPVPIPGQHTDEIISSVLGDDSGALSNLRSAGAIA